ncbi:MAG: hypothetical protein HZA21_04660 [Nitrospirae bacterium]|nr:hypothetical protein [Nitrospirota bacterium]
MRQALPALSAFTAGLYFAVCQVGYFIVLEFHLSSTFVSYFSAIGLWLLGGFVGLFLPWGSLGVPLVFGGLAAYYLHGFVLSRFPYNLSVLPLSLTFIFVTALYSGYFFRHARRDFGSAKALFFHENNGFLLGYVVAFTELLLYGQVTQQILPLAMAGGHLLVRSVPFAAPVRGER